MDTREFVDYVDSKNVAAAYFTEYALSILKPSEVSTTFFWLPCLRVTAGKRMTSNGGKWMIFADWEDLDMYWEWIKRATILGHLGPASKVSTRRPTSLRQDESKGVICIYTYNYKDLEDIRRVRSELADMGFTDLIYYKTNEATRSGLYGANAWLYSSDGDGLNPNSRQEIVIPS